MALPIGAAASRVVAPRVTSPMAASSRTQSAPVRTTSAASSSTQAHQPGAAGAGSSAVDDGGDLAVPARPEAGRARAPTMCRSPSAGVAGGAVRVRSRTDSCTSASSIRSASLWVTCFCACAAARYGSCRWVVSIMSSCMGAWASGRASRPGEVLREGPTSCVVNSWCSRAPWLGTPASRAGHSPL
jgi:hypothetical protein